jgi:hypothetical protein
VVTGFVEALPTVEIGKGTNQNTIYINGSSIPETDPIWNLQKSNYVLLSSLFGFHYYNSSDFDINNYYLKSNPYGFYNATTIPEYVSHSTLMSYAYYNASSFSIVDYYLKSNPFGFYNSTTVPDYVLASTLASYAYYNSSSFNINDYYLKNNPFGFYNTTTIPNYILTNTLLGYNYYNSTNFNIADYYLKSNPYGFYNSTNPQTETDPLSFHTGANIDMAGNNITNINYLFIHNDTKLYLGDNNNAWMMWNSTANKLVIKVT